MNWTLIAPILTSSVLAAFLTKLLDLYTAKLTYRRDYYKKVIDERMNVYLNLNNVLYKAVGGIANQGVYYCSIFRNYTEMTEFISGLMSVANSRIWLTTATALKLRELIELLTFKSVESNISSISTDAHVNAFGSSMTVDLMKLVDSIEVLVLKDLKNLYDVKSLFNEYTT